MQMATDLQALLRRRAWLMQAAVSALAWPGLAPAQAALARPLAERAAQTHVLTAWDAFQRFWAGSWTPGSHPVGIELPARAHEVLPVTRRLGEALAVARRPGEYLARFDMRRRQVLQWHAMEEDRFLEGHAAFSADGSTLFTTESRADTGQGIIAARDPLTLRKRHEFASGGVGPHALLLEPQGTLLAANGGLLTLPETGRRKLNRMTMDSSLVRIDPATGLVLQSWRLADPFLSVRHIARADDGTIAVALQAEHEDPGLRSLAPLLALVGPAGLKPAPTALASSPGVPLRLDGYAGDVAYLHEPDGSAGVFVASAVRAGQLVEWTTGGEMVRTQSLPGVCALASGHGLLLASAAHGAWQARCADAVLRQSTVAINWDNHARLLA